jgi:hypothetical protein
MRLVFSAQTKDLATAPTRTRSAGLQEENLPSLMTYFFPFISARALETMSATSLSRAGVL